MSSPYGPTGSPGPPQGGQQPPGQGYDGTPSGGFPAQDPNWGYQQGYPPPGYGQPYGQPAPGYEQPYGQPRPGYEQPYGQPGYQDYGPQGGQQPHPGGHEPTPPKQPTLPWMLTGVGGIVLALIIFLGFVTPGFFTSTVFDQNAVQDGVHRILSDDYGQNAEQVTCPANQEVQTGSRFTCRATIDGEQHEVTITVKTDAGEYEVARPS